MRFDNVNHKLWNKIIKIKKINDLHKCSDYHVTNIHNITIFFYNLVWSGSLFGQVRESYMFQCITILYEPTLTKNLNETS